MEHKHGWAFTESSGPYLTDETLFAAVKATRNSDSMQLGQWAIVVREEDIPAALRALHTLLELQIAELEKDEGRDNVAPR